MVLIAKEVGGVKLIGSIKIFFVEMLSLEGVIGINPTYRTWFKKMALRK